LEATPAKAAIKIAIKSQSKGPQSYAYCSPAALPKVGHGTFQPTSRPSCAGAVISQACNVPSSLRDFVNHDPIDRYQLILALKQAFERFKRMWERLPGR
jgi:hypothetical protein